MNSIKVGERAPDFDCECVIDKKITNISLGKYDGKYLILLFYPQNFTPVDTTEIIMFNKVNKSFEELDVQLLFISGDTVHSHLNWINKKILDSGLGDISIPLISDVSKKISKQYNVLIEKGKNEGISQRSTIIIDSNKNIRHIQTNDIHVGRSIGEIYRVINAIKHYDTSEEECQVNWNPGEKGLSKNNNSLNDFLKIINDSVNTGEKDNSSEDDNEENKNKKKMIEYSEDLVNKSYENKKNVVLFFTAQWCRYCKFVYPVLEKTNFYDNNDVYKVDVDYNDELFSEFKLEGLPSIVLYKNGDKTNYETATGLEDITKLVKTIE